MAPVKESPETRAARLAYARAIRADPSGESPAARKAASNYALEYGRAALAELMSRADDLDRDDARILATELRELARELRPGR